MRKKKLEKKGKEEIAGGGGRGRGGGRGKRSRRTRRNKRKQNKKYVSRVLSVKQRNTDNFINLCWHCVAVVMGRSC